jgi:hypothetical protein
MENRERKALQRTSGCNMNERILLGSSAIAAVTYDETKRTLIVEFRGGDSYLYSAVPRTVYQALLKTESAGGFWNEVKDQFNYVRLD